MNNRYLVCLDLETSSVDPYTCDVFEIASLVIDPHRLKIIEDSEFISWICPDNIKNNDYYSKFKSSIDWHAKNFNLSSTDFLNKIKNAPPEKIVWEQYIEYIKKYHTTVNNQNVLTAPIPAGYNIIEFDLPIIDRLCIKYKNLDKKGRPNIFYKRDTRDIMHIVSLWLSPLNELKSLSLDNLRSYLGISTGGAHEALKDVYDEARILIRFLSLHQKLAQHITFKNSFISNT